jgi:hypothetical protein
MERVLQAPQPNYFEKLAPPQRIALANQILKHSGETSPTPGVMNLYEALKIANEWNHRSAEKKAPAALSDFIEDYKKEALAHQKVQKEIRDRAEEKMDRFELRREIREGKVRIYDEATAIRYAPALNQKDLFETENQGIPIFEQMISKKWNLFAHKIQDRITPEMILAKYHPEFDLIKTTNLEMVIKNKNREMSQLFISKLINDHVSHNFEDVTDDFETKKNLLDLATLSGDAKSVEKILEADASQLRYKSYQSLKSSDFFGTPEEYQKISEIFKGHEQKIEDKFSDPSITFEKKFALIKKFDPAILGNILSRKDHNGVPLIGRILKESGSFDEQKADLIAYLYEKGVWTDWASISKKGAAAVGLAILLKKLKNWYDEVEYSKGREELRNFISEMKPFLAAQSEKRYPIGTDKKDLKEAESKDLIGSDHKAENRNLRTFEGLDKTGSKHVMDPNQRNIFLDDEIDGFVEAMKEKIKNIHASYAKSHPTRTQEIKAIIENSGHRELIKFYRELK